MPDMSQQRWSNDPAYRYWRNVAALAAIALVTGCATVEPLMPTPTVYVGQGAKPLFVDVPVDRKKPSVDLLYITDRAPGTEADKTLPYTAEHLMGSLRRLGRYDETLLSKEQVATARGLAGFLALIRVTNTPGFIGHSYFLSDPAASADLVSVVRYGLGPGDPGRPLEEISRPFWKLPPPRADAE
jgi:hypothetical protein